MIGNTNNSKINTNPQKCERGYAMFQGERKVWLQPNASSKFPEISLYERKPGISKLKIRVTVDREGKESKTIFKQPEPIKKKLEKGFYVLDNESKKYLAVYTGDRLCYNGFDSKKIEVGPDGKLYVPGQNNERFKVSKSGTAESIENIEFQYDKLDGKKIELTSEDIPYIYSDDGKNYLVDIEGQPKLAEKEGQKVEISKYGYPFIIGEDGKKYLVWPIPGVIKDAADHKEMEIQPNYSIIALHAAISEINDAKRTVEMRENRNVGRYAASVENGEFKICLTEGDNKKPIKLTKNWKPYVQEGVHRYIHFVVPGWGDNPTLDGKRIEISEDGTFYITNEDGEVEVINDPRNSSKPEHVIVDNMNLKLSPKDDTFYVTGARGNRYVVDMEDNVSGYEFELGKGYRVLDNEWNISYTDVDPDEEDEKDYF